MRRLSTLTSVVSTLLLGGVLAANLGPAYGQSTSAELRGNVEDKSHAMIANATITATNTSTGRQRSANSNAKGTFSIPDLQPATYTIEVSAPSFGSVKYPNVVLTVGEEQVLEVSLPLAQANENVVVQGTVSGVELASSSLGGVVDGRTVKDLPLNGRDWSTLALLEPGVSAVRSQNALNGSSSNRGSRGLGAQVDINGNRPTQNIYFLDGLSVNDYANGTPGNAFGVTLGVDAIQEFSVVTSNYNATYGQASGGIINAVTRSGTNKVHGDVYEFLRNDFFDARNYFDPVRIPPLRRNQYGIAAGGPIWKDHTFIFANYEGLRWIANTTSTANVPTPAARAGQLTTGTITVDPAVAPFLALWPLPNCAAGGGTCPVGNVAQYSFVAKSIQSANFGTLKVDHQLSTKDNLSATYSVDDSSTMSPDSLNSLNVGTTLRRNTGSMSETHIFNASMVNVLRLGANRVTAHALVASPGNNAAAQTTALGILPGRDAPYLSVPTLNAYTGGQNGLATTNFAYTTSQVYDDVSLQKRSHTIKIGGQFVHYNSNEQVASVPNGEYDFPSLQSFLQNIPSTFYADLAYAPGQTSGAPTGLGFPERGFRQSVTGLYIQDDWRVLSNLTLNLGLRYERASVPTEEHGRLSNLYDFTTTNLNPGAQLFNNPTNKNFEPRVGFAWDPYKNGKVSVRGAFGVFDVLPLIYEYALVESYAAPSSALAQISLPYALDPADTGAGSFPNGGYRYITSGNPVPLRVAAVQRNPARNYILQDNLSVQYQLSKNTVVTVAYAGNHGVHMVDVANDANYGTPVYGANGIHFDNSTRNIALGGIRQVTWQDSSNYNALQTQVEKHFGKGFQFKGSYTWSRSLDGFSSSSFPTTFQNSLSLLFFNHHLVHGPSDYDVTNVAVLNGLWDLPSLHAGNGALRAVTNGWTASGILQLSGGEPFTPVISGDALTEVISSPYDVPNYTPGAPGCNGQKTNVGNPVHYINVNCYTFNGAYNLAKGLTTGGLGNAGRNSIFGPGVVEMDISALRNFPLRFLSEASRLQFRADAFNVTNRTNFQAPFANNKIFSNAGTTNTATAVAAAGLITLTSTSSRQMQLSLKLIW